MVHLNLKVVVFNENSLVYKYSDCIRQAIITLGIFCGLPAALCMLPGVRRICLDPVNYIAALKE